MVLLLGAGAEARKLRSRQDEKEWLSGSRRIRVNSLMGQVGGNGEQGRKEDALPALVLLVLTLARGLFEVGCIK